jgi:murein DD-endopeptidase MepM/ murein hydrolase activator NlpD
MALARIGLMLLLVAPCRAANDTQLPLPDDLNIRIIGVANFQGKYTALIEDSNTKTDSFYKLSDSIYGYRIAEFRDDGLLLTKGTGRFFMPYASTTLRTGEAPAPTPTPAPTKPVIANLYLPENASGGAKPNYYLDGTKSSSWDAWAQPSIKRAQQAVASVGGKFIVPLRSFKRISSGFGYRNHPLGGGTKMHKGLDMSARSGTGIRAAAGGTVTFSGWRGGYGRCVVIDHHNGFTTTYGHCSKLVVDLGDNVGQGDYIADVGSTGASTGPHLHFEIRKGDTPIDPETYLKRSL